MSETQWPSAGFILSSGENRWVKFVVRKTDTAYDLLVWRNLGSDNDYYCARVFQFPTDEMQANPFTGAGNTLKLTLVYSGGKYAVYGNDKLMFELGQGEEIQNGHSISSILGSGNVRLGLFAERQITFTDWNFRTLLSTDAGGFAYDPQTGGYSSAHDATDNQAYIAEAEGGVPFTLEADMKNMSASQWPSAGFILNAGQSLYGRREYPETEAGIFRKQVFSLCK